jgi:hypothetical protein
MIRWTDYSQIRFTFDRSVTGARLPYVTARSPHERPSAAVVVGHSFLLALWQPLMDFELVAMPKSWSVNLVEHSPGRCGIIQLTYPVNTQLCHEILARWKYLTVHLWHVLVQLLNDNFIIEWKNSRRESRILKG